MPRRVTQEMPGVERITDPVVRESLRAMQANIRALLGQSSSADDRAVTVADMKAWGFVGVDGQGRTYAKLPRTKQAAAEVTR